MPWSVRLDSLWSKSFKADLLVFLNLAAKDNKSTRRNWITTGVSETEVWVRFLSQALSCFVSCEVGTKWESHIFTFFVLTLWDYLTQRASHTILFTLFIVSCLVSTVWLWADKGTEGKRVLPNFWHKRLRHINNLRKRRLCTILLRSQSDSQSRYFLCISQFQLRKAPPPPGYYGAFANFVLPGTEHLPTPGPFPSFWYARGFLSEYNYAKDFTGKESRFAHLSRTSINWRGL